MKLLFASLLAVSFLAFSCSVEKTWISRIRRESVPTDVKNSKYVLLVEKPTWSKIEGKQVEDFMQIYPGKWEMVEQGDLQLPKYADTTKYRYFLKRNPNGYVYERSASAPAGSSASVRDRQFWSSVKDQSFVADQIFVDRKLNKEYPSTGLRMGTFSRPIKYLASYIQSM